MKHTVSFQVDDLIKKKLEILCEAKGKNQSDVMRSALQKELNKMQATISSIENSSNQDSLKSKSIGSLTTYDMQVINFWKEAYSLGNVRLFAPPIKAVLNKLRKEGLSQDDIITLVKGCRKAPMVRKLEQMNHPKAPPLSSILSTKMIPHLLFLLDDAEPVREDVSVVENYKREIIDSNWLYVPEGQKDEFREDVMSCGTVEEVDTCTDTWFERIKDA